MTEALSRYFPGLGEWLILLVPLLLIAYFIPFLVAAGRKHRFTTAIGLINLLLGWTVVGWLAAMIWAVNRDVRELGQDAAPSEPAYFLDEPRLNEPRLNEQIIENQPAETGDTKKCPFCAETIKAQALVCRYCAREVDAPVTGVDQGGAVNIASMEKNFEELLALLKDREESAEQRFAEIEPATNYVSVSAQEKIAADGVSAEVAHQLSGWKKFG
jgi:hypothetical protein